jgi:outer membrane lipoprotein carrier protein
MNKVRMKKIALFLIAACAISARAGGLESLETFVQTVHSGKANFVQVVTAPSKAGQAPRQKTSSGTFEFSRPNRFKFVYLKPFAQTLVADGQTLWLWDVDLNQVTARKQAQALGSTPAALIASATSVRALEADFTLTDAPAADGLEWVMATPKSKDSSLQTVRMGFKGTSLERLDIQDSFGQQSVLTFNGFQANAALDAASFQFKPPADADVVRQ